MIPSDSAPVAKKRNENVTLSGPPPESVTDVDVQPALTPEAFLASVAAEKAQRLRDIADNDAAIATERTARDDLIDEVKAQFAEREAELRESTRAHRARLEVLGRYRVGQARKAKDA